MKTLLPDNSAAHLAPPAQDDPLDHTPDAALADVARLAATICGASIAVITLGDDACARLAAYRGPADARDQVDKLVRTYSAAATGLVLVPDILADPQQPSSGTPALRFYAGLPLLSAAGQRLGALAVLDQQPRTPGDDQLDALHALCRQLLALLELRQAQALDAAMLATAESLAIVVDRQGRIVRVNHACEQLSGYTLDEIRGQPVWDVFMPASEAAHARAAFAQLAPDALPQQVERSWMTKDGRLQRLSWSDTALLDERGAIRYVISSSTTLPERRRRTATLQKEQTFLTVMLDNLEDGIIACDAEGVITLFNRATREFYGLPAEPVPAARWAEHFDLYLPDGRTPMPPEQTPLFRALQGEHVHNAELVIAPRNGQPRTLLASGQPIIDAHGTKLGAVVAMHNITERKQAEHAQRASEERLRMLISNAPVILYTLDLHGIITMSDGKGLQSLGLAPGQMNGRSVFELYGDLPEIVADLRRALAGESFQTSRTLGGLAFETWYEPLHDTGGALTGVLGISIDVSDRRRIAEEQTRLQEEIIRVQAATLAELSTPLIPLNDQIVVMPLVGALDSRRVQQVLDTLLRGVETSRAQVAILDITGVPVVDTQVANVLLQAAQAVKLLGARVVLTGIRPEVAQTLVGLGIDLRQLVTRSTLQSGISYATAQG